MSACKYVTVCSCKRNESAFTLIELLVTMVILAALLLVIFAGGGKMIQTANKARCISNLKSLHIAAGSFLQEYKHWPQVPIVKGDRKTTAKGWVAALSPYGVEHKSWICPSLQKVEGNPDFTLEANYRIDYYATPFDPHPYTPYKWAKQPWFAERADGHGNGQLIIFPAGEVEELGDLIKQ